MPNRSRFARTFLRRLSLLSLLLCCGLAAQTQSGPWRPLFDGKSLEGWRETPFTNKGKVQVDGGAITLLPGSPMTGVTWAGEFPKSDYELRFEAARQQGNDFFASLTFPVADSFATWVTGGWGGDIVGMSSIDGRDASENETRSYFNFENGRWYVFRLEVRPSRVKAWIDTDLVFNVEIAGREISLRYGEIRLSAPLGFAAYATKGAIRKIEYRELAPAKP
jgi:hypothetical protein